MELITMHEDIWYKIFVTERFYLNPIAIGIYLSNFTLDSSFAFAVYKISTCALIEQIIDIIGYFYQGKLFEKKFFEFEYFPNWQNYVSVSRH